jgi:hypothetical protein
MNSTHVYELDTDELIRALRDALEVQGYEITEQAPVGIWWLRAERDRPQAAADLMRVLNGLLGDRLREISQEG